MQSWRWKSENVKTHITQKRRTHTNKTHFNITFAGVLRTERNVKGTDASVVHKLPFSILISFSAWQSLFPLDIFSRQRVYSQILKLMLLCPRRRALPRVPLFVYKYARANSGQRYLWKRQSRPFVHFTHSSNENKCDLLFQRRVRWV